MFEHAAVWEVEALPFQALPSSQKLSWAIARHFSCDRWVVLPPVIRQCLVNVNLHTIYCN